MTTPTAATPDVPATTSGKSGRLDPYRDRHWFRATSTVGPWIVGALALIAWTNSSSDYVLLITSTVIIYSISAIGLNVLMGQAGLVSIGNGALMAIGAYTTAILGHHGTWGDFPITLIVSAVIGGVIGLLIALPALRLKGIYLALATLALQFFVVFAGDRYQAHTGAVSGVTVRTLTIGGRDFSNSRDFVLVCGVILGLVIMAVRAMSKHAPGRMWNALRESELAATAIGVNAARWKLAAFVVSSSIIAVSGSLFGYANSVVSSDSFTLEFAVTFIAILILGGMGRISGAIVGSIVVVSLPYLLTNLTQNLPQDSTFGTWLSSNIFYINNGLYGILVLVVLLYLPEGIVPALGRIGRWGLRLLTAGRPGMPRRVKAERTELTDGDRTAMLSVRNLTVTYQTGARAVADVNLRIQPHTVVALLGRNGAGKTSTLRAISGFLAAEQVKLSGAVLLEGRDVLGSAPMKTAARGVVLVAERDKIFPSLTVAEHLKLVSHDYAQVIERPYFHRLKERLDQPAGLLSGGERQLLALATASLLEPKLLMVDEFTLGLAPVMILEVARVIRGLRMDGMTVLLVEQNAAAALDLADRLYLMDGGQLVAEGSPEEMKDRIMIAPTVTT
ncbi:MAG TPA: ATP-binding cassette domain-containing protein [Jatrophihabitantaceae bacterium]